MVDLGQSLFRFFYHLLFRFTVKMGSERNYLEVMDELLGYYLLYEEDSRQTRHFPISVILTLIYV